MYRGMKTIAFALSVTFALCAQPAPPNSAREFDISGAKAWLDTGIDLKPGDSVSITATGSMQYPDSAANGPDGLPRSWKDLLRILPLKDSGRGALLTRVGDADTAVPFLAGSRRQFEAVTSGRLFIGINQAERERANGNFHVKIQVTAGAADTTANVSGSAAPFQFPAELLDKMPRRVSDQAGNAGDCVNFLIVGSEADMQRAFESAGWVKVDRTTKDAIIHGLLTSLSKESYVEMPMSELRLYGRGQDYGFAHAEPLAVVMSRHHLRVWKAPFEVGGQTVWVGAATHDIGFDRDRRNNGITHKIDPAIDLEREYVAKTFAATALTGELSYMLPADPVTDAVTATGEGFHSDGRILLMPLKASNTDRSVQFAGLFCSVLQKDNPDTGAWGDCAQYIKTPPPANLAELGTLPDKYRVLIVPGFFSACASATPAFKNGQDHLRQAHGVTVEMLTVPNDTSENNGTLIAKYLKEHLKSDPRKYIVLGYSKGTPDVQEGLANDPEAARGVAAFVSVAGAAGGSPIAAIMPAIADKWIKALNLTSCEGDIPAAFKSLRRDVRRQFLTDHPKPPVPTYSIAAVSNKTTTSKMLLEAWQLMSVYGDNDSQLSLEDATIPGSYFLGTAAADHLAVALPFEDLKEPGIRAVIDHGHYPRAALLESLVRFVVQDLATK